jgi:hypothetical protein
MTAPLRHPLTSADISREVDALGKRQEQLVKAVTDWREDPRAMEIFDSLRRNPPRLESRTATYVITRDEWSVYVGQRVDRLESIYGEHETRHRLEAAASECWDAYDAFTAFPTPQQAITEALNPADVIEPTPVFDMMMADVISAMRPQSAWGMA